MITQILRGIAYFPNQKENLKGGTIITLANFLLEEIDTSAQPPTYG